MQPRLKLKLILNDDATLLGPGKVALLEAIQREHSLSKAAKSIGMSYRRAWNLIAELNDAMAEPVISTQTGGHDGGGSVVTESGQALISLYHQLETVANDATASLRDALTTQLRRRD
ncbi:MAG: LysR family transcriptional regulator [Gammaproteobacteria bacterium]|nr:LysR family transcriptional regulator [Gammaproteobacteria bacterium]